MATLGRKETQGNKLAWNTDSAWLGPPGTEKGAGDLNGKEGLRMLSPLTSRPGGLVTGFKRKMSVTVRMCERR